MGLLRLTFGGFCRRIGWDVLGIGIDMYLCRCVCYGLWGEESTHGLNYLRCVAEK